MVGEDRDANKNIDAADLFYGAMAGDVQPDWVDTSKIAIPQADEQQRLLVNLIMSSTQFRCHISGTSPSTTRRLWS